MKTIVYRYTSKKRTHRVFNTTGKEKNPNQIRFYAKTMEYAEKYKNIDDPDGGFWYACELETAEVDTSNLFDMDANFEELNSFDAYIEEKIEEMRKGYTADAERAKANNRKRDIKMFQGFIEKLDNGIEKKDLVLGLKQREFQDISDFHRQDMLIAELTAKGFNGYHTKKEIAIF